MKLREKEFGNVYLASGSTNLDGKGWKQDIFFKWHPGFNFEGATKILKTFTVDEHMPTEETKGQGKGNMVIDKKTLQSKDWFPDCIRIDFFRDRMTNAVGLSNPGAKKDLKKIHKEIKKRTILSAMCVRKTRKDRMIEAEKYVSIFHTYVPPFIKKNVAQEDNETCPNTGHRSADLDEIFERLSIFQKLGVPLIVKLDSLATVEFIRELASSKLCDAIDIPNSLKVGERPDRVNWKKLRYLTDPILKKYGTCGYSGRENFLLAIDIVEKVREAGVDIPIMIGGVSTIPDIHLVKKVGGNAIVIGRAVKTRFWRVESLINESNIVFGGKK